MAQSSKKNQHRMCENLSLLLITFLSRGSRGIAKKWLGDYNAFTRNITQKCIYQPLITRMWKGNAKGYT